MTEFLYGRQAIREALRAGRRRASRLLLHKGTRDSEVISDILRLAREHSCALEWVEKHELERFGTKHQGLVLEVSGYPYASQAAMQNRAQDRDEQLLLLVLDHIEDPRNLGAILRTADAVGVHGVVLPKQRSAAVTPVASDTSAGAAEHLLVAQVANIARTLEQLKRSGVWVAGLEGSPEAQEYRSIMLDGPLAIVVGSEGSGLSRLVKEKCDWLLRLPMRGRVESLNASVAASILLYWVLECREGELT
jgi:23S rRNA (guanosine2251-2'-O)-methyltransferase